MVAYGWKVRTSQRRVDPGAPASGPLLTGSSLCVVLFKAREDDKWHHETLQDQPNQIMLQQQISSNPLMHEKTKYFDIDVHLVKEKVASVGICADMEELMDEHMDEHDMVAHNMIEHDMNEQPRTTTSKEKERNLRLKKEE
ncbi:hypothetical protein Tco_0996101 [Tanacetum coccineum]